MTALAVPAAARALLDALATGEFEALQPFLAATALFDATVPGWRFQLEGPTAIVSQLHQWWPTAARLPSHRTTPTAEGVVVEFERRWAGCGGEEGCRQVHVITLDGDRIAEMRITCAGRWDEQTLRAIDDEAPIFRP